MIIRIVKIHFKENHLNDFFALFETVKWQVASFPECHGMKLLQDKNNPSIVMTYSLWESEAALENYRKSDLFSSIWPNIKPWFEEKAEAWTVEEKFNGFELPNP
jgi:quinol monooxygenase YgiN